MLILMFLGIIASVPLIQTAIEIGRGEWPQALEVLRRKPSVANLRAYEQNLEDASWASRQARPQVQFAQFEWLGDVLRMLQVPEIERRAIPETIPCVQVYRRDPVQPYQDDPNSEVLVLGDSFLRIYQQDEPGAAGFIAHLANELGQPLTSLVNDGGASTLVRQELYRRPVLLKNKKVVVWEFVERDIRMGTEGWQIVPLPPRA
jgi:hypothetical protein